MSVNPKFNEQVIGYVEKTSQALGVALKLAEERELATKAAANKVPSVMELLKKAGLVDNDDEKVANDQLRDHAQTLDILNNVVDYYTGQLKEANAKLASASLGTADDSVPSSTQVKEAGYYSHPAGASDEPRPSDLAMMRLLD